MNLNHVFPVIIVQDRYGGAYSGGAWIAIAEASSGSSFDVSPRLMQVLDEAHGGDGDAACFWHDVRDAQWLAVGETPDAALAALLVKNDPAKEKTPC